MECAAVGHYIFWGTDRISASRNKKHNKSQSVLLTSLKLSHPNHGLV